MKRKVAQLKDLMKFARQQGYQIKFNNGTIHFYMVDVSYGRSIKVINNMGVPKHRYFKYISFDLMKSLYNKGSSSKFSKYYTENYNFRTLEDICTLTRNEIPYIMEDEEFKRFKTICQVCGNKYGSEEFMLGMCHGLPLINTPFTDKDYNEYELILKANSNVIKHAKKLGW